MFQVFLDAASLQQWLLLRRLPWTRTPTHSPRLWKARSVLPFLLGLCYLDCHCRPLLSLPVSFGGDRAGVSGECGKLPTCVALINGCICMVGLGLAVYILADCE